jgi:hypothetical protein
MNIVIAHVGGGHGLEIAALSVNALLLARGAFRRWTGRLAVQPPRWEGLMMGAGALICLAAAVALATTGSPKIAKVRPTSTATLTIVAPSSGEIVDADTLDVRIQLAGGRVVDTSTATVPPPTDEGHLHMSIDGMLLSMTGSEEVHIPVADLDAGPHTLGVEYVAVDHGPFNPRVTAQVSFVKGGGPLASGTVLTSR